MTIEKIYPEYIRLDGGTQPRAKIDEAVWKEYGERMKAGDKFPPVTVFFDGENYWLVDGFHRQQAHFMYLPGQAMECEVHQGTLEDAQWYSYTVNRGHGVRRTHADIERAVRAALAHPKSRNLSDVAIAEHVGVSHPTVAKRRKQERLENISSQEAPAAEEPPVPRLRTGRDGRTINTAKIGSQNTSQSRKRKSKAAKPIRGHSKPIRMIPLQFCPDNSHTAAAALIGLFPRSFLEGLVQELTQYLKEGE